MITCEQCREMFAEALYGELDAEEKKLFENHLGQCPDCAAEYTRAQETVGIMGERERPEPAGGFLDGLWGRLEPRLAEPDRKRGNTPEGMSKLLYLFPRPLFSAAAGIVLFLLGLLAGRSISAPETATGLPDTALLLQDEQFEQDVDVYFERSKIILTSIANVDPVSDDLYILDLQTQRKMSRDLYDEARPLRQELAAQGKNELLDLVLDLQMIMFAVSKIDPVNPAGDIYRLQEGISERALLMKMTLMKLNRAPAIVE